MPGDVQFPRVRFLRSCNLLPNDRQAVELERVVLRLVVSVANSWGNLRQRRLLANRTCLSRCLDDVMFSWGMPAPAAQSIALSTRGRGWRFEAHAVGYDRSTGVFRSVAS
jgi:hypothetical protein